MKELSDSEFDRIFQKRVQEFDPAFEESSWELMDKKLRRRDRIVFLRKASMVLTVLLLLGGSIYFYADQAAEKPAVAEKQKRTEGQEELRIETLPQNAVKPLSIDKKALKADNENYAVEKPAEKKAEKQLLGVPAEIAVANAAEARSEIEIPGTVYINTLPSAAAPAAIQLSQVDLEDLDTKASSDDYPKERVRDNKPVKLSLSFAAGPDFNSVKSIAGNQPTLNGGILLNAAFTNHFSISTGLRFGAKNYNASSYNYGNLSPALINAMAGVEGSCDVLEIPLRASYTLINNKKKSISFNSGLSSYLMLREKYVFSYTPESGYDDYVLEKVNANRHYFSVLEVSAVYRFKSKSSKTQFGIEPYVKLPLGGVGEGKVHLKSSGVTLNLFYELSKKNK